MKKALAALLMVMVITSSVPSYAGYDGMMDEGDGPSSTAVVLDIVFTRPLGLAATVIGTAVFVVGLPFTIPTGSVGVAADRLIAAPLRYTFTRPIGEVDGLEP